jgi:hypothetical protein
MPSAPPNRDLLQEGQTTLNAQQALAGQQYGLYNQYSGLYGQTGVNNLAGTLGNIDAQEFLRQHPEFQEGWDNAIATGDDPMRWLPLAINAASYIDQSTIPRGGGIPGVNAALTGAANQQTTASNTALRQGNLADAQNFGGQLQGITRGANTELFGLLGQADARAGQATAASPYETQAGQMASGDPRFGQFNAGQVSAMGANKDPFLSGVLRTANSGPSGIQSELQRQAYGQLRQGGQLSAQEVRGVINPIQAKYAAAGLGQSNAVLADQVLNLDAAQRARMQENQQFAAGVDAQGYSQQMGRAGLGLGGSGAFQGYAGQDLQAQRYNQEAQQQAFLANLQAQGQQFGQLSNVNAMGQQRQAQDLQNLQFATGGRLATYQDPFSTFSGQNSANYGTNNALYGMSQGITNPAGAMAQYDPFNPYAQDLYNTNYNGQYNANIAAGNNKSSMWGSVLGAVGTVGGAIIGGPIGAAAGAYLGKKIGGG